MIQNIIRFSLQNKVIVGALVIGLIGWGALSLKKLPLDAIPDVTSNQVNVVTIAPNLAPVEMEQFVTYPVEMALANIQGLTEIRSVSQFGLSLITLEFKEHTDLYWARAQINERLQTVKEDIPQGFGSPQMLPVTTGLGEVYQYSIQPKDKNDTSWTLIKLREVQDWIVKRQLLGTEGVAEVSSFGGHLKQYHVRVKPEMLKATGVTLQNVFTAIESSNANTGAAYIEKNNQSYFIRGIGLATSKADLENTFIKSNGGIPVSVRDVATIEEGSSIRFGALTNEKTEIVGGIILMLKGENSRQVVLNVKEKLAKIEKNLPKGLEIKPFIDREALIERTIETVAKNLVEGGIIVIFVLLLLLGHFRAGLIIASVIPLAMLFTVACMVAFGVSGNLMSLGAIDFGLIVDGAVIIIENAIRRLSMKNAQEETMDKTIFTATKEIMQSAVFGSVIIMLVYVPLLLLEGIEGKMFKPMALTVIFALIGALILSLTYVPVMASLFLKKSTEHHATFADRLMNGMVRFYRPILIKALRFRKTVMVVSLSLLVVAFLIFQKMGGEFIPQLDEGDFVVQLTMMPGTSLTQMVEMSKSVGALVKKEFPNEILETTGKIGTSEVPTDPMSVEEMDMILTMNDRDKWQRCHSRTEFEEQLNAILEKIPGVTSSIQQPIAMRFNELMTGAKTDVIVKVLGPDLDKLAEVANDILKKIKNTAGVADPYVAKAEGMPQLFVTYKRDAMMRYGVSTDEVGRTLRMALAGEKAGVLYEESRRFDVIVKLQTLDNQKLDDVGKLSVTTENGSQIPLSMLADIEIKTAPMAVNRENGERSVNVNLNIRGRDVATTVAEIQHIVDSKIVLPQGYRITYGGQFENLENARTRLLLVVPAALLMILLLLYLSFGTLKESLLIFTAIPFAAVGGVFALELRGMPFSISAGVGFIALFGVAVLNGMVLIGYFKQLHLEGRDNLNSRILRGAIDRFRPVIMTATVASLGFLPMALAAGAGAEVQKPLATVVIGGLITSTILTLGLLPVLYAIFMSQKSKPSLSKKVILFLLAVCCLPKMAMSQSISEQEAVNMALKNHPLMLKNQSQITHAKQMVGTAKMITPSEFSFETPQLLMGPDNVTVWTVLGAQQSFLPKKVYNQNEKTLLQQAKVTESELAMSAHDITQQTRLLYQSCLFASEKVRYWREQDSIFKEFNRVAEVEFRVGKITPLEKTTAESFYKNIQQLLRGAELAEKNALDELKSFLKSPQISVNELFTKLNLDKVERSKLPVEQYYAEAEKLQMEKLAQQKLATAPSYSVGVSQYVFNRFIPPIVRVGVSVPLWKKGWQAAEKAAELETAVAQKEREVIDFQLNTSYQKAMNDYLLAAQNLEFYEKTGLSQAAEILRAVDKTRQLGSITTFDYLQSIRQAFDLKMAYLMALQAHNEAVLKVKYYMN
ncbi:MAG: CusA/CzcA family heavy metal efflux RND transporter [Saprospiraceae bacterium]|nr:CusA/CzcA family heavy metal efflux RND transporter [Saprospiraceae bacterium]